MNQFRPILLACSLLALATGLMAYGVSPAQTGSAPSATQAPLITNSNSAVDPHAGHDHAKQGQPGASAAGQTEYVSPDWAKAWEHIDLETATKWQKDSTVLFIDARAKVEYDQGHIPGAIPMPVGEFDKYYGEYSAKIKKASMLVTYCHGATCQLSNKVAQKLYNDKGHKNVASFFGGWPQWSEGGLPVEK